MANHLKMATRETILALHRRGWSKRKIARELGVDRGTIRRLLRTLSMSADDGQAPTKAGGEQAGTDSAASIENPKTPTPGEVLTGIVAASAPKPSVSAQVLAETAAASAAKTPVPAQVLTGSITAPAAHLALPAAHATAAARTSTPDQTLTGSSRAEAASAGGRSKCEPYRRQIEQQLAAGLSAQRIFQDLREDYGFAGAYHSVQRLVRRLKAAQPLPFRRLECEPGSQAQVDFGKGAPIVALDKRRRHSHVLRSVLSFSRKGYSEAFFTQGTESLLAGLEDAFWAWGGVPKTVFIDNTKAAVKQADWYDPEIHPVVLSFCQHYGTVLLPIKARTPRHNGKAEANIGYVKNNGLKGRTFPTLAAENEHLARWERQVADLRIHGTTKQQVRELFESEKRALLPLPAARFPFFREGQRIVHRDGHVEVAKAYYSVPPEYTGHTVWVRWDSHLVRILDLQFSEIALHARQEQGRFATAAAHLSSKKIALVESGATVLLGRVRRIGPQAARWAEAMLKERELAGVRVLVGLLALARRHTSLALERACAQALQLNAFRLREVRALLKASVPQAEFEFMAAHPLIRNLHDYGSMVRVHFGRPWEETGGRTKALN